MDLEAVPSVSAPGQRALSEALERVGARMSATPTAYESAWRAAGVSEATEPDEPEGYTLSPRSTRGATRA